MMKDFSELNEMVEPGHWTQRDVQQTGLELAAKTKGIIAERPNIPTQPCQGHGVSDSSLGEDNHSISGKTFTNHIHPSDGVLVRNHRK